jgi:hypothetical protein
MFTENSTFHPQEFEEVAKGRRIVVLMLPGQAALLAVDGEVEVTGRVQ